MLIDEIVWNLNHFLYFDLVDHGKEYPCRYYVRGILPNEKEFQLKHFEEYKDAEELLFKILQELKK